MPAPRFDYESDSCSLKQILSDMGMPSAFWGADFSGINDGHDLFIKDVIHKAFISVGEFGTEAAASTAVVVNKYSAAEPAIRMNIDHHFIYMIKDVETDTVIFMGRILNPDA